MNMLKCALSKIGYQGQCHTYCIRSRSRPKCGEFTKVYYLLKDLPLNFYSLTMARFRSTFPKQTHYDVLELTQTASSEEIRQSFLRLSKQCHPDISKDPSNHHTFVKINEAYSVLIKPLSRSNYDLTLDTRFVHQNVSYSAHSRSGYPDSDYYHYHYRGNMGDDSRSQEQNGVGLHAFMNFYVLTACFTICSILVIIQWMYKFFPDPRLNNLRRDFMTNAEIEKHDLIMTSECEGIKVFYYAIPSDHDPGSYDVVAIQKKRSDDTAAAGL